MSDQKIDLAGASWCGYTKKMEADIQQADDSDKVLFNVVDCSLEGNKDNQVCQGVSGFPTFKNATTGEVCHRGYADIGTIKDKCLNSPA